MYFILNTVISVLGSKYRGHYESATIKDVVIRPQTLASRAANRSLCFFTQQPIREQPLSSHRSQNLQTTFSLRRRTKATPPGFHRSTNHRHATQQNEQTPLSSCPTSHTILT
ncbi:hypothetical protein TNCV_1114321 [Trichonephila clavipes]|nr:hypothetical protein TNCV_1114321 [Trichonephila clavipes]